MNNKYKYLFITILVINGILAGIIVPKLIRDKQVMLPAEINNLDKNLIDLKFNSNQVTKDSLKIIFPYSSYFKSNNYQEAKSIQKDLIFLDSIIKDKYFVRKFMSKVLTDSLNNQIYKINVNSNLDTLNLILQWTEKFKNYGESDPSPENQILFKTINSYWSKKISKTLGQYSEINVNAKYNFHFRYLTAKCNEKRFNVSVKVTSIDKLIQNVLENRWAHLFEATWNQSTVFQKIIIFIFFAITTVSYILAIKYLLKIN